MTATWILKKKVGITLGYRSDQWNFQLYFITSAMARARDIKLNLKLAYINAKRLLHTSVMDFLLF